MGSVPLKNVTDPLVTGLPLLCSVTVAVSVTVSPSVAVVAAEPEVVTAREVFVAGGAAKSIPQTSIPAITMPIRVFIPVHLSQTLNVQTAMNIGDVRNDSCFPVGQDGILRGVDNPAGRL